MTSKVSICLIIILGQLFIGCSKNPDGTTSALPAPPTDLTAVPLSDSQVTLSWRDNSTNEVGFKIERKNGGGVYSSVGTVGINVTTFTNNGLTPNTNYSYRVFSHNNEGNTPTYSNEISVTTNASLTTTICGQIWVTKNLDVTTYRNGDAIPQVTDQTQFANLTTGAWCYYNNDPANGPLYGKLYNWYAVTDTRGLAPLGWHIPSETELNSLATCLGGAITAGGKLKAVSSLWFAPNTGASNSSGYTALPGGHAGRIGLGVFFNNSGGGHWWSSTASSGNLSKSFLLTSDSDYMGIYTHDRHNAFSVRCIKD